MKSSTPALTGQTAVVLRHPTFSQPAATKLPRKLSIQQMKRYGVVDLWMERTQRILAQDEEREHERLRAQDGNGDLRSLFQSPEEMIEWLLRHVENLAEMVQEEMREWKASRGSAAAMHRMEG